MSTEQFTREPPKNRAPQILTYVAVAVVMFGAGMLLESHLAAQTAASAKLAQEHQLKQAEDKAEEQRRTLTEQMEKEREDHANAMQAKDKNLQAKDKNLAAVSSHAAGVRKSLEADLSAARASGDACTSRIAGISEALNGVFDSVGEVAGIAQDLGRENQQLKEDNKSLSDKLAGWQKWNTERSQRVTVVKQKSS